MYDVIIVGAGASGCFLALTLKYKNPNLKVALMEKNDKLGKKLLITGNGRCNLGNTNITIDNYNSSSSLNNFISQLKENDYLKREYNTEIKTPATYPTEKGKNIGITAYKEKNNRGLEYIRIIYGEAAQKFIGKHMAQIINANILNR